MLHSCKSSWYRNIILDGFRWQLVATKRNGIAWCLTATKIFNQKRLSLLFRVHTFMQMWQIFTPHGDQSVQSEAFSTFVVHTLMPFWHTFLTGLRWCGVAATAQYVIVVVAFPICYSFRSNVQTCGNKVEADKKIKIDPLFCPFVEHQRICMKPNHEFCVDWKLLKILLS